MDALPQNYTGGEALLHLTHIYRFNRSTCHRSLTHTHRNEYSYRITMIITINLPTCCRSDNNVYLTCDMLTRTAHSTHVHDIWCVLVADMQIPQWCNGSLDQSHMVDPLSYFSFHPVLHNWCNKGCGMCCPVCGMVK